MSTLVLGIDTATPVSGIAVGGPEGVIAPAVVECGAQHAEHLIPAIRTLCASNDISLHDLSAIAVDIGPGLFTGLRVGVMAAKSLAMALGIGVVGLVSLDVLVHGLGVGSAEDGESAGGMGSAGTLPGSVVAAVDARRGEVFAARYGEDGTRRTEPAVMTPDGLAELVRAEPAACLVGDGARRYFPEGIDGVLPRGESNPSAVSLVNLAVPRVEMGECTDPGDLVPLYLRHADTRIRFDVRQEARGGGE